jgi:hypothetical protein
MEREMKTYLKIKIKSLADEARIIKQEERKWKAMKRKDGSTHPMFFSLRNHRCGPSGEGGIRWEIRHSLLAYGFMRGRLLSSMENVEKHRWGKWRAERYPDFEEVWTIAERFGTKKTLEEFCQWCGKSKEDIAPPPKAKPNAPAQKGILQRVFG